MLSDVKNFMLDSIQSDVSKSMELLLKAVESNVNLSADNNCMQVGQSHFSNPQSDAPSFNLFDASLPPENKPRHESEMNFEDLPGVALDFSQPLSIQNVEKEVADTFEALLQSVEAILNLPRNQNFSEDFVRYFDDTFEDSLCRQLLDDVHLPDCSCHPSTAEAVDDREVAEAVPQEYHPLSMSSDADYWEEDLMSFSESSEEEEGLSNNLMVPPGSSDDQFQPQDLQSLVIPVLREEMGDRDELVQEMDDNDFVERMMIFFREMELWAINEDDAALNLGTGDHSDRG